MSKYVPPHQYTSPMYMGGPIDMPKYVPPSKYDQAFPPGSEKRRVLEVEHPMIMSEWCKTNGCYITQQAVNPQSVMAQQTNIKQEKEAVMIPWCEFDDEGHGFNPKKGYMELGIEISPPAGKGMYHDESRTLCWKHALEQGFVPKEQPEIEA